MKFLKAMPIRLLICFLLLSSCSHFSLGARGSVKKGSAKFHFKKANFYKNKRHYQRALSHIQELRRQHPYSEYSDKVFILSGDIYFKQKKYKEAMLSYEKHLTFYPIVRRDYVLYQLGLSYKNQLPRRAVNDLSLSEEALEYFALIEDPEFKKKAQKQKGLIEERRAEKALRACEFFRKIGFKKIALKRVKDFKKRFPGSQFLSQALKIGYEMAYDLKQDTSSFKDEILKNHPKSEAAKFVENYNGPTFFQKFKEKVL